MRFVKRLFIFIVILIVALVAGAFLLPQNATVERTAQIDAPPEEVFPYVNSMQKTGEWSPWLGLDPDIQLAFSGPEEGVGNVLEWASESPDVGSGRQEITASVPNERVETALDFGEMGTATAYFNLTPEGDGTQITWGLITDAGMSPVGRWMNLMMDRFVGPDYEKGLANLKALLEGA